MPSLMISRIPPRSSIPSFCASASRIIMARVSFFRRLAFGIFRLFATARSLPRGSFSSSSIFIVYSRWVGDGMNAKISQNASSNPVTSLRLWSVVDFLSNSVYAEPVQVRSPCIQIPPHNSVKQLGSCQYYSMFEEALQVLSRVFLQSFQNCETDTARSSDKI